MTPAIQEWVRSKIECGMIPKGGKILEIGSRDVNGSVRQFFDGQYIGIDAEAGPGVDMVSSAHELHIYAGTFDTVLCLEMLEHDPKPWLTRAEMYRVLKPGGTMVISVPTNGFPEHKYPLDCFRYLPDAFTHFFFENMKILALDKVSSVLNQFTLIGAAVKI